MNIFLLTRTIAGLGAAIVGGGCIFLTVDHSGEQIQMNKHHKLIKEWNERSENLGKVCNENDENNCRLTRTYIPEFEDQDKWEFLYHEANFDYLLEKTKPEHETWGYPFTEEQIKKIRDKNLDMYGILDSVDINRRDRNQYEEFGFQEWKRFRKMCMIMLENNGEVTVNPLTSGILCAFDEWSQEDYKTYKEEREKSPRSSNWEVYLKSVSKFKKSKGKN